MKRLALLLPLLALAAGCARNESQECFTTLPGRWLVCTTSSPHNAPRFDYEIIEECTLDLQPDGLFLMTNWNGLDMPLPDGRNFITTNSVRGNWSYRYDSRTESGILTLKSGPVPTSGQRSLYIEALWRSRSIYEHCFAFDKNYRLVKAPAAANAPAAPDPHGESAAGAKEPAP